MKCLNKSPFAMRRVPGSSNGSVTVELVFVVPVLLFILASVFMTGRIISQLAWMSQSAFQGYLVGAEFSDASARANAMASRWDKMFEANHALATTYSGPRAVSAPQMQEITAGGTQMLSTRVTGSVLSLMGSSASVPLAVTITGPMLAPDAISTDLSNPANPPAAQQRNCRGVQGGASTGQCTFCPSTNNCYCGTAAMPEPYQIPCP